MNVTLQPVQVATGAEEEGMLLFADERLVAVLVHLSEENEVAPGQWYFEAGFGPLGGHHQPTFPDLDAAQDWIERQLAGVTERRTGKSPVGPTGLPGGTEGVPL
jgi:hypothetical protein